MILSNKLSIYPITCEYFGEGREARSRIHTNCRQQLKANDYDDIAEVFKLFARYNQRQCRKKPFLAVSRLAVFLWRLATLATKETLVNLGASKVKCGWKCVGSVLKDWQT